MLTPLPLANDMYEKEGLLDTRTYTVHTSRISYSVNVLRCESREHWLRLRTYIMYASSPTDFMYI